MPSRRRILSSAAVAVGSSIAGCSGQSSPSTRIEEILVANRRDESHTIQLLVLDADDEPALWRTFRFGPRDKSEAGRPSGTVLRDLPKLSAGWAVHAKLAGRDAASSFADEDVQSDCVKLQVVVPEQQVDIDIFYTDC